MKYQLRVEDPSFNREVLKQFLRDHAKQFDMGPWLEFNSSDMFDIKVSWIEKFEICGSACCIGGAAAVLAIANGLTNEQNNPITIEPYALYPLFGLGKRQPNELVYSHNWPEHLRQEYNKGILKSDPKMAVEAGCKAIDWYIETYQSGDKEY